MYVFRNSVIFIIYKIPFRPDQCITEQIGNGHQQNDGNTETKHPKCFQGSLQCPPLGNQNLL